MKGVLDVVVEGCVMEYGVVGSDKWLNEVSHHSHKNVIIRKPQGAYLSLVR